MALAARARAPLAAAELTAGGDEAVTVVVVLLVETGAVADAVVLVETGAVADDAVLLVETGAVADVVLFVETGAVADPEPPPHAAIVNAEPAASSPVAKRTRLMPRIRCRR